ncbi:MAG: hypothetical protein KKF56_04650 [Nanoarchaeota archaeon]|nr:hypothetical protein [Nanoarchaeota archaeon]
MSLLHAVRDKIRVFLPRVPVERVDLGKVEFVQGDEEGTNCSRVIDEVFFRKTGRMWNDVSVLELEGADCYAGKYLSTAFGGVDYTAICDLSKSGFKPEHFGGVRVINGDTQGKLPLGDEAKFDRVIAYPFTPETVGEVASHLKPDGRFVLRGSDFMYGQLFLEKQAEAFFDQFVPEKEYRIRMGSNPRGYWERNWDTSVFLVSKKRQKD